MEEGKALLTASSSASSHEAFALIIDGKSLTYALEDDFKKKFLDLATGCASVICCRSSPKQKALVMSFPMEVAFYEFYYCGFGLVNRRFCFVNRRFCFQVTRLVKSGTGKTTLAIGDGANDVGMLQEADIGVGISGVEGMQAVMSSDIAIAQFRYLERLLLVHGHWCYSRISSMVQFFLSQKQSPYKLYTFIKLFSNAVLFPLLQICYFFYKNITFGVTVFLYEAYTSFSAQPAYNDWFLSLFNVFFSSLPVIALGVFDQDVSARYCYKVPKHYLP